MPTGVILAGGRSRRFGDREKALAPIAGTPMIRRVADRLEPALDRLVVNCRRDQRPSIADAMADFPLDLEYAIDTEPDRGPVAGIHAGLSAVDREYAAVVACDMPLVDPDCIRYLFERASGLDGAVARLGDGRLQPTQAVYRTDAMAAACAAALDRDRGRLTDVIDALEYATVSEAAISAHADASSFENVNTPADLERVTRYL